MRRWGIGLVLGLSLVAGMPWAEASVGDWVKNTWQYLFSPINCVAQLGKDVTMAVLHTGQCVLSNANRVPTTLQPVFSVQ